MGNNRNMMLALVLSALVILGWSFASSKLFPPALPQTHKVEDGKVKPIANPVPDTGVPAPTPAAIRNLNQVLVDSPRVAIRTQSLQGSINLKGARIDDLVMLRQTETIDSNSKPVRLLSPAGARGSYFGEFGWFGTGIALPDANTVWTPSATTLSPGKPVTLSWTNPTGQRFELIFAVDDGYMFTVRQRVANSGTGPIALRSYGLVSRADKSKDTTSWTNHVGPISFLGGKADYRSRLENHRRRQEWHQPRQPRRLGRLHRQILADRARPRQYPGRSQPAQECRRRISGRLRQPAVHGRPPARR